MLSILKPTVFYQCLQTPNVNILLNTISLSIDGILDLNLNPISESQSELLRMHVKTRKTSDYNNVQKELIYVLFYHSRFVYEISQELSV